MRCPSHLHLTCCPQCWTHILFYGQMLSHPPAQGPHIFPTALSPCWEDMGTFLASYTRMADASSPTQKMTGHAVTAWDEAISNKHWWPEEYQWDLGNELSNNDIVEADTWLEQNDILSNTEKNGPPLLGPRGLMWYLFLFLNNSEEDIGKSNTIKNSHNRVTSFRFPKC